jgi:hypothetical protein
METSRGHSKILKHHAFLGVQNHLHAVLVISFAAMQNHLHAILVISFVAMQNHLHAVLVISFAATSAYKKACLSLPSDISHHQAQDSFCRAFPYSQSLPRIYNHTSFKPNFHNEGLFRRPCYHCRRHGYARRGWAPRCPQWRSGLHGKSCHPISSIATSGLNLTRKIAKLHQSCYRPIGVWR